MSQVKALPAPSVKKLLRDAGYTYVDVARRRGVSQSLVSRAVRKQIVSAPVWDDIVALINKPRQKPRQKNAPHDQRRVIA